MKISRVKMSMNRVLIKDFHKLEETSQDVEIGFLKEIGIAQEYIKNTLIQIDNSKE